MRENGKSGQVKKFQYVSPVKHETLPQQWAKDNILKSNKKSNGNSNISGVDLDNVWSIKRNFAIETVTSPSKKTGGGIQHNSFYSRYKNIPSAGDTDNTLSVASNNGGGQQLGNSRVWNRGSTQSSSASPADDFILHDDDDDEFGGSFNRQKNQHNKYSPVKGVLLSYI